MNSGNIYFYMKAMNVTITTFSHFYFHVAAFIEMPKMCLTMRQVLLNELENKKFKDRNSHIFR